MPASFYQRFDGEHAIPEGCQTINSIDMHTGGEPLRVITSGYPDIQASSLLDYRRQLKQHHDSFRTSLMFEPRGHADMYGCLILPPFAENADCSVIFMHNEGYSTMCGHAVIAIMTLAMQMLWVDIVVADDGEIKWATMTIEAPCGLIRARGEQAANGKITTSFECVPSFVAALDQQVTILNPITGQNQTIHYDLAYGGAFYAYVDTRQMDLALTPDNHQQLIALDRAIKQAVIDTTDKLLHPFEPDLNFLYGTIFIGEALSADADSRNVCIFADGEVDRSPTGSGVSGRMAIHYAKGEIGINQPMVIESIIGSKFTAQVARAKPYGHHQKAVIPKVCGDAFICAMNTFIIQPQDRLKHGFLLR
ncbi:MAG: proline racemase [Phenylobacterium sp.]|jgi:proline racemase